MALFQNIISSVKGILKKTKKRKIYLEKEIIEDS